MFEIFKGENENVSKYVFMENDYVAETVLYKYEDFYKRTVICCSTQSGCPVGCSFCGTGKKFIRNLTHEEITDQIFTVLKDNKIEDINHAGERFQIMFMSMGEPMLNWDNVEKAIVKLHRKYPNAELLISTIGIKDEKTMYKVLELSKRIDKIGLQISIHQSNDVDRDELIPFKNKLNLKSIRNFGTMWWNATGRKPYLNYCINGKNNSDYDFSLLSALFSPLIFNFTFSVICESDENGNNEKYDNINEIEKFQERFIEDGYNTRVFNPEGQDDIGGGCGQLWYVQKWMKEHDMK